MELVNEEGPASMLRAWRNAPKRPLGTKRTEPKTDPNNIVFIKADADAIYPFKLPYKADSNAIYAM